MLWVLIGLLAAAPYNRPFGVERQLLERRLETLRRILPDGPTPDSDVALVRQIAEGAHLITVTHPDGRMAQREVRAVAGAERVEEFRLPPLVRHGALIVDGNVPGATVHVDGRPVGTVPFAGRFPEGPREVVVRAQGYDEWTTVATVQPGGKVRIAAALERTLTESSPRASRRARTTSPTASGPACPSWTRLSAAL